MIKVSVIVPVYNVEKYIRRCLSSIIQQTFSDWEALIIDDCGIDDSINIAKEFAEADSRFRIIHNPQNLGLGVARDEGLKVARGKYIVFIDSDDWIPENMLETMCHIAVREDADIVVCGIKKVKGLRSYFYLRFREEIKGSGKKFIKSIFDSGMTIKNFPYLDSAVWNKLFRRELLTENKIHHPCWKVMGEDMPFTILALLKAKKVVCTPETFYFYFQRKNSICRDNKDLSFWLSNLDSKAMVRDILRDNNYWGFPIEKSFNAFCRQQLYDALLNIINPWFPENGEKIFSMVWKRLRELDLDNILENEDSPIGIVMQAIVLAGLGQTSEFRKIWPQILLTRFKFKYIPQWLVNFKANVTSLLR